MVGWVQCRGGGGGGTKELWGFEIREGGGGVVGIVLMKRVICSFLLGETIRILLFRLLAFVASLLRRLGKECLNNSIDILQNFINME